MDENVFLQRLHDLSLEEGRIFIERHCEELHDYAAFGVRLKNETQRQEQISSLAALKLAELLICFGEHTRHGSSHALGLIAKGNVLKTLGYQQAALTCLDAAGQEFLDLDDSVGWARSRISWVISASWLGRVEEALLEAARARAVFDQHGQSFWTCLIDHNTAVIYTQLGRYQEAIDLYANMLTIYPTMHTQSETLIKHSIATAQVNQARCLALIGDFEQSYRLQQQAQQSFIELGETFQITNSELNLAVLDYAQGYYGSALERYYRARDNLVQNAVDEPLLLASLNLEMADCLVKLNRTQEACQQASEAVEICRRLGISLDTGELLCRYATTLVASGRLQEAVSALNEAEALFTQGNFDHCASAARLQQAELLLQMGAVGEAYSTAHFVKTFFDQRGLISRSVRASVVMVGALIESVQQTQEAEQRRMLLQEAILLCKQTTLQARQHNLQEHVYKCQHLLGRLAELQGNLVKAAHHYVAAVTQIERILYDLAHDLSPAFLHTTWAVYESLIALCLRQGQAEQAFGYLERARSVVLRQYLNTSQAVPGKRALAENSTSSSALQEKNIAVLRMQRELEEWQQAYRRYSTQLEMLDTPLAPAMDKEVIMAELKRCEVKLSELFERLHLHTIDTSIVSTTSGSRKAYRKGYAAQHITIAQVQSNLQADQLLLAYFLYRGRLVIFAVSRERLVTYEQPEGGEQLERLLLFLHAHLQSGGWQDIQRPPQVPIRRLLQRLYNLLIAPIAALLPAASGYLTIVPYGPLHNMPFHALYNGTRFLIEDFQIHYLPATGLLTTARSQQHVHADHEHGATRAPLVLGCSGSRQLPRILEEAKTLATLLHGHCYLEEQATIARLIEQAPGSSIIHLATHGHSRLDAPNFSSVLLADGPLNALDAFSLDLKGCELVTLSGCETGLSLSGGGDEQLGLGRAFLAAGAASLVMSLWPVEDNATNALMQIFYQRLLAGDNKAQALRTAQCQLLQQDSPTLPHPYFWSAFRLVGDISPLRAVEDTSVPISRYISQKSVSPTFH